MEILMVAVVVLGALFLEMIRISSNVSIVVDLIIQRIRVGICMVVHRRFRTILYNEIIFLEVMEDLDSMVVDQVPIM